MRRTGALFGLALAVLLLAAGAAASSVAPDSYLGEWTADASSQAPVASQVFTVASSDEATARTASGTNSINFDVYCKSTAPNVQPVTYFTVASTSLGTFGGCVSAKTQGHIFTWNTGQVWYGHTATLKGEPLVKGALVTSGNVEHKFTAHHPAVKFLLHVKYTQLGNRSSHVAELTTMTGGGEFHILSVPADCSTSLTPAVVSGDGTIAVRSVKIDPPSTVELDSLSVKPVADQTDEHAWFSCDHHEALTHVAVTVTKSDPAEKDACPVGAPGLLWLVDAGGNDGVKLDIPKCKVDLALKQSGTAKKHHHVAVAETIDEKGY